MTLATDTAPWSFESLRRGLGVPLAVAVAVLLWAQPLPAALSPAGYKAIILFAATFILYLTEAVPLAVSSLLVGPAAVLMGIVAPAKSLSGFASPSVYLILGAFVLAAAMVKTRLAERITYRILAVVGCTATRVTLGVTLANIVLAFLIPSSTARTAVLLPICLGVAAVMGGEGRTRFAVNLLLTLAFTNATISAGILTATVPNPVTIDFIAKAGSQITYVDWLIYGFPPALLMTLVTWLAIQVLFRSDAVGGAEATHGIIRERLQAMGRTSAAEWRTLAIFLGVVLAWATQGLTKLDTTVVCLVGAGLLFLPRLGVIEWSDANREISWQIVLVCGGGITLGDILTNTGAAGWIAGSIFHHLGLEGAGLLVILLAVMVVLQFLHLVFVGTTAMATGVLPIVLALAQHAQIDPRVLVLPAGMIVGGYPVLMFYSTLPNIIVYGTGRLTVGDFPRVGVPISLVACGVYAVTALTYWHWVGMY